MERRNFLQQSALAGASLLAGKAALSQSSGEAPAADTPAFVETAADEAGEALAKADKPFNMNYGFHDGMFRNNGGTDFIDQIKFAYDKGFRSIEDNGMMSRTPDMQKKIGETLAKLGMTMGVFVITSDSWHWKTTLTTGKQEWIDKMVKDCKEAVEVAKRCHAKWMTVVPGNYERSLSHEYQTANVIKALRMAAGILEPHDLVMVLEPLSDNPDLFLRHSGQTFLVCKAVNSPSCKILFDMYHMQRNEGDIINNINKSWDEIGYFQIGDNPGRKEPGTGEMNYRNIFKHIHNKGYRGVMGMEHGNALPGKEGELALIKAYREADSFM